MTPESAAYVAGIVDGEGTISLSLSMPKRGGYQFGVRVCVTTTSQELLDHMLLICGGSVSKKKSQLGRKECFRWNICDKKKVALFLEEIKPYLVIKKPHAEIVLEYLSDFITLQQKPDDVKAEEIGRRTALYERIQKLNGVG